MNDSNIVLRDQYDGSTLLDEYRAPSPTLAAGAAPPLLLQYWQIILRWRYVILAIIGACEVAGFVVTLLMTPQYTAGTRLEISREAKKVANVAGVESEEVGRDQEFYQTQYSLLEARTLAERVVRDLRLSSDNRLASATGAKIIDPSIYGKNQAALRAAREMQAVGLLIKNVQILPIARSSLVDIKFTSSSPKLSADIVNSWAREFIEASIDRRFSSTSEARHFLEGRLSELRTRLQQSEGELVEYATRNGIVALSSSENDGKTRTDRTLVSEDLEALNKALGEAVANRIQADARRTTRGESGTTDSQANAAIVALRQRYAEVSAEYAKLLVQYDPRYPAARALKQQMGALNASISREMARARSGVEADYQSAVQRENALREKVASLSAQLDNQKRASIQYNIYQRDVDTNRQLYDGLLQRYKEIGVAGVSANNIAIVDTANVPTAPSSPKLALNLAIALLVGFGAAGIAVFGLEQIDEGLRMPHDLSRVLHIPLLGSVPFIEGQKLSALLRDTKSSVSEAYLTVRSNLSFSTDHGVPRSLVITSTRAKEGKSTSAMALALVLGRTGKSVLLVDADMRSPSAHKLFGVENTQGLSNVLSGDDNWLNMTHTTEWKGLSVLTSGPLPPSAAELLSSERTALFVDEVLKHFDHVVIDAPPILGLADAPLLSRLVEGVIFVVEAEGVSTRGINNALGRLRNSQARIYGGILTKLKRVQAGFGYGYGYGYGYDYSYGKD